MLVGERWCSHNSCRHRQKWILVEELAHFLHQNFSSPICVIHTVIHEIHLSNVSTYFTNFPPSLPFFFFFSLLQLCCSVIQGNWCVKVRLFVSHSRIAVTALPTVCLFTLMSPAAMVTCFYLPSPFEPSAIKHSQFLWFPRPWSSKGTLVLEAPWPSASA